jgi:hypothetical protein
MGKMRSFMLLIGGVQETRSSAPPLRVKNQDTSKKSRPTSEKSRLTSEKSRLTSKFFPSFILSSALYFDFSTDTEQ